MGQVGRISGVRRMTTHPGPKLECCNEDCGWVGPASEAVHPKHDASQVLCPECYEVTEAVKGQKGGGT